MAALQGDHEVMMMGRWAGDYGVMRGIAKLAFDDVDSKASVDGY
jgi:hypothetical protein